MERNISALVAREFDVVVVGGGIFGICTAWEAASRGLSVALIEREDFGAATSANSFKMIHGGIRYLQHGDLVRMRESSHERSHFLRCAPHLVEPLPIVIPTYGHGMKGKEVLGLGCIAYDLLTLDRNRGISDPARRIPSPRSLSRAECLETFPGLEERGLTGGVMFHDGQIYNPPRLSLAYVRSAVIEGAVAANYVAATGFVRRARRILGVEAVDRISGETFEIRSRMVINATGAWTEGLLQQALSTGVRPALTFSRDAAFVVRRKLTGDSAVAVLGETSDPDALLSRPARHLFVVPWRDYTLVGVWHVVHEPNPEAVRVRNDELQSWIDEVNGAYPALDITLDDVSMWNAGLVLFGENQPGAENLSYGKRSRLVDHAREDGIDGLLSLVGVRYTTARGEAQRAVDLAAQRLGGKVRRSATATTPLYGGDVDAIDDFADQQVRRYLRELPEPVVRACVRNHGSKFDRIMAYAAEDPDWAKPLGDSTTLAAEVVHAAREEMVTSLADVVFRRTDLGTAVHPGADALDTAAQLLGSELGWDEARKKAELEQVEAHFARVTPAR